MNRKKPARPAERPRKRRPARPAPGDMHPAGPHARPELTDDAATPGTGALSDITKDKDVDPGVD